jgi:hypothetical protein
MAARQEGTRAFYRLVGNFFWVVAYTCQFETLDDVAMTEMDLRSKLVLNRTWIKRDIQTARRLPANAELERQISIAVRIVEQLENLLGR